MGSFKRKLAFSALAMVLIILMATAALAVAIKPLGSGVDPATDENMAVWARADGKEVHLYNLAIWKDSKIKTSLSCYPGIDVSTNTMVWCENGKSPRLTVYNTKTKKANYIAPVEAWTKPAISNGMIVWSYKGIVNLYDIATKSRSVVAAGYNPDISGGNIAYEAVAAGTGEHDIVIYNIVSKENVTVDHVGDLSNPRISGDYVVFRDEMGNLAQFILATGGYKVINVNNIPGHSDEGNLFSYAVRGPVVVYDTSLDGPMGWAGVYVLDDGRPSLVPLSATGDNTGARVAISGDTMHGFDVLWGFVPKADSNKKVNGGIYYLHYDPTDAVDLIKTGNLYVDTQRDGTRIAVFQKDRFITAKSGRILDADLPVGEYMLILSGMGDPATVTQRFNLTEGWNPLVFPIN